jgi:uncharacterized protein YceK
MCRGVTACLAAGLFAALSGCGTAVNCLSFSGSPPREIYGGVKQDAQSGTDHLAEAFSRSCPSFSPLPDNSPSLGTKLMTRSFCAGCGLCMLAVDLPVSAVADTLTLPVTIPAALRKGKSNHPPKRRAATTQTPAAPLPAKQPQTIGRSLNPDG